MYWLSLGPLFSTVWVITSRKNNTIKDFRRLYFRRLCISHCHLYIFSPNRTGNLTKYTLVLSILKNKQTNKQHGAVFESCSFLNPEGLVAINQLEHWMAVLTNNTNKGS